MASSIVNSAVKQVGNLLVEEAKFLYKVHDKIESLQTELEWMECFLEDADSRQHQEKLVCKWVAQIANFAYEAEDIIERYLHEVPRHQRDGIWNTIKWFSNIRCASRVYTLHNLGSDIDELTTKVSNLNKRLKRYGIQFMRPTRSFSYSAMTREERRTYSHIEEEVIGLEKDVQQVVAQLMKKHVNVVSISGMGGLGKSTLARRVFVDKYIKQHFGSNCVWVYISKEFSRRSAFEEILIELSISEKSVYEDTDTGKDKDPSTSGKNKERDHKNPRKEIKALRDEELAKRLYDLIEKKRCLIILDDIWTTEAWESLKPALGSIKRSRSKILLSTRNQDLLQYIDPNGYSHCLDPLDVENSWKLLQLKTFPQTCPVDAEEKTKMEKLGKEMLQHCHGLPLAIIALGGILSSKKTLNEWEDVQKNISSYLMTNMGDGGKNERISSVLELSYHDLPFHLKPFLLYLGNFPEDYEISTQRLYHLWEAEGILEIPTKSEASGETSYELAERRLMGLIQRSMVQVGKRWANGRIKTCRVHDLIRDMCIRKSKEISFLDVQDFIISSELTSIFADGCVVRKMHRCAFHMKAGDVAKSRVHYAQQGEKATCIRSLLVFQLKEDSDVSFEIEELAKMAKYFPLLRVLDLQGTPFDVNTKEISHLIHLRYLNFRGVYVNKLSSQFWDLKYLVTLDLRSKVKMNLPDKFHLMERLRHLYLPEAFVVQDKKKLSLKVHQMETLKNFHPEKCEMIDLLQMTSLRIFSFTSSYIFERRDALMVFAESKVIKSGLLIKPLFLRMKAEVIGENPEIIASLFKGNSCYSKLRLVGKFKRSVEYPNIENAIASGTEVFPRRLTHLEISHCRLGREIRLALEKLPNLERLELEGTPMGRKVTFSPGSFPRLNYLSFSEDYDIREWEVGDGALPNLQQLEVYRCLYLNKLPQSLPDSIHISCYPCIEGIKKYNTCSLFKCSHADALLETYDLDVSSSSPTAS